MTDLTPYLLLADLAESHPRDTARLLRMAPAIRELCEMVERAERERDDAQKQLRASADTGAKIQAAEAKRIEAALLARDQRIEDLTAELTVERQAVEFHAAEIASLRDSVTKVNAHAADLLAMGTRASEEVERLKSLLSPVQAAAETYIDLQAAMLEAGNGDPRDQKALQAAADAWCDSGRNLRTAALATLSARTEVPALRHGILPDWQETDALACGETAEDARIAVGAETVSCPGCVSKGAVGIAKSTRGEDRGTLINRAAYLGAQAVKLVEQANRMPASNVAETTRRGHALREAQQKKAEADRLWRQVRETYERSV